MKNYFMEKMRAYPEKRALSKALVDQVNFIKEHCITKLSKEDEEIYRLASGDLNYINGLLQIIPENQVAWTSDLFQEHEGGDFFTKRCENGYTFSAWKAEILISNDHNSSTPYFRWSIAVDFESDGLLENVAGLYHNYTNGSVFEMAAALKAVKNYFPKVNPHNFALTSPFRLNQLFSQFLRKSLNDNLQLSSCDYLSEHSALIIKIFIKSSDMIDWKQCIHNQLTTIYPAFNTERYLCTQGQIEMLVSLEDASSLLEIIQNTKNDLGPRGKSTEGLLNSRPPLYSSIWKKEPVSSSEDSRTTAPVKICPDF